MAAKRRQRVADDLGDRSVGVGVEGALVGRERSRGGDEATPPAATSTTTSSRGSQVPWALASAAVIVRISRGTSSRHGPSLDLGRIRRRRARPAAGGAPVGHGEQPGEQRDRDEHEQQLVPATLVGERRSRASPDHPAPQRGHDRGRGGRGDAQVARMAARRRTRRERRHGRSRPPPTCPTRAGRPATSGPTRPARRDSRWCGRSCRTGPSPCRSGRTARA